MPPSPPTPSWPSPPRTCAAWAATCSPSCTARRGRPPRSTRRAGPAAAPTPSACGPRATRPCPSTSTSAPSRCPAAWTAGSPSTTASGACRWPTCWRRPSPTPTTASRRRRCWSASAARLVDQGNPAPALHALAAQARRAGDLVRRPGAARGAAGHRRRRPRRLLRRPVRRRAGGPRRRGVHRRRPGHPAGDLGRAPRRRGVGPPALDDAARPPRATSRWRRRGSPTGWPLPEDPDDPQWAHLLVEAAVAAGHDRLDVLAEGADGRGAARAGARWPRGAPPSAPTGPAGGRPRPAPATRPTCAPSTATAWACRSSSPTRRASAAACSSRNTGINLHNRGLGFSAVAGHPAEYGPGRRPPHTLSPALVTTTRRRAWPPSSAPRAATVSPRSSCRSSPGCSTPASRRPTPSAAPAGSWRATAAASTRGRRRRGRWRSRPTRRGAWLEGLAARGHRVTTSAPFGHQFGHANVITVADPARGRVRLAGAADPRGRISAAVGR